MVKCKLGKLKYVTVRYTDGTKISTSMNPNLKDSEVKSYFKVGKKFNVGSGEKDKITKVKSVRIVRERVCKNIKLERKF